MASAREVLNKAISHIGEDGTNTWKAYNMWGTGWAWCCAFVWRVFKECNASNLFYGGGKTASVGIADNWLYNHCKWVKYSEAQPGDIVVFTWEPTGAGNTRSGNERSHIGFFEKRISDSTFYAIEGNTGSPSRVRRRERARKWIYAIYRPNYGASSAPSTPSVSPSPSTGGTMYTVNASDGLNVRAGAGTGYKRIDGLPCGTKVLIVKTSGNWGYSNGAGGWVCMDYLTKVGGTAPAKTTTKTSGYRVGSTYKIVATDGLKVRSGAGTGYRWKKRSELSADGKRHAALGTYAVLKYGTAVTCLEISGNWMRIPSGWICCKEGNSIYVA